jgi:hypothetical protein
VSQLWNESNSYDRTKVELISMLNLMKNPDRHWSYHLLVHTVYNTGLMKKLDRHGLISGTDAACFCRSHSQIAGFLMFIDRYGLSLSSLLTL